MDFIGVDDNVVTTDIYDTVDTNRTMQEGSTAAFDRTKPFVRAIYAIKKNANANKWKKRQGAKAVRAFERDEGAQAAGALNHLDATTYRAISARGNYLAQDRADTSFASKELCRDFGVPNHNSLLKLKRYGRYLLGRPRLVYRYDFAESPATTIDCFVDTDFAGCSVTRRSTSGGCMMVGGAMVKHWSKTQPTIALSSGEAELGGICAGTAQAIGLQSLAADMSWSLKIRVHSDATAAIGISKRRGLGKVRHLHTSDLWIQDKVKKEEVDLVKILGAENPADAFTKYLDQQVMNKALQKMNLHFEEGRARAALATAGTKHSPTGDDGAA